MVNYYGVYFKYDKFLNYCYFCGRLGYVSRECNEYDEEIFEGILFLVIG